MFIAFKPRPRKWSRAPLSDISRISYYIYTNSFTIFDTTAVIDVDYDYSTRRIGTKKLSNILSNPTKDNRVRGKRAICS